MTSPTAGNTRSPSSSHRQVLRCTRISTYAQTTFGDSNESTACFRGRYEIKTFYAALSTGDSDIPSLSKYVICSAVMGAVISQITCEPALTLTSNISKCALVTYPDARKGCVSREKEQEPSCRLQLCERIGQWC
jgi:hypothetical protein